MTQDERRQGGARFKISDGERIRVMTRQAATPDACCAVIMAELQDISCGGARIKLVRPLRLNETTHVSLYCPRLSLDLSLSAEVCWSRKDDDGEWSFGFEFIPPLPSSVIDKLIDHGVADRREKRRESKRIPITLKWAPSAMMHPAYLWDISAGGFSFLSTSRGRSDVLFWPDVAPSLQVPGTVLWQLRMGKGYISGCKFVDKSNFENLRELCLDGREEDNLLEGERVTSERLLLALIEAASASAASAVGSSQ